MKLNAFSFIDKAKRKKDDDGKLMEVNVVDPLNIQVKHSEESSESEPEAKYSKFEPQIQIKEENLDDHFETVSEAKDKEISLLKARVKHLEGQLKIKDEALKHLKNLHEEQKSAFQNMCQKMDSCHSRTTNIFEFISRKPNPS